MAEYINLAWPPTYGAHSFQQQQGQAQQPHPPHNHTHVHPQQHQQQQQLQQQQHQHQHQFAVVAPNPQNPNINPNAGPSSRPAPPQASYAYGQYPVASSSASTSTLPSASTSAAASASGAVASAGPASASTPPTFRAPAHKHAHHLHSIPPREKSTRTLIIDHMLWVHGRTRFAQARAELGMTDRTGGPASPHYPHRRRPEACAESDDELSAGEDTQPLRARQGDPGNPHADAEDARKGRQDLALARSLRLRAEGVEKVVIGMLEGGPGGASGGGGSAGSRPAVGRTGTGNGRTTGSGSSPHRLPNGVRLRLALGTIINDLFARQAPPPPHRHTRPAAAGASPSTSRTSGSTPVSTADQTGADGDDEEELPRALWTLAPASAAFVRPRRAKRKTKTKRKAQQHQQGPSPSFSGQQQMPSMTSAPAVYVPVDYSAQFPPPSGGAGAGAAQWHPNYQAMQQYSSHQQQQQQQYHSQSPQYQHYGAPMNQPTPPGQQRPSSSSSSMSMHPRPSSSPSVMLTPPIPHYQPSPHHQQNQHPSQHPQRQHSHAYSQTPPTHPHTHPTTPHITTPQSNAAPITKPKPKTALPKPSSRVTRLYSVGADPDTANSPPAFRCPRHLHTGCEICVEAKAAVGAISAKGHGGPRDTRSGGVTSPGGPPPSGHGNGHTNGAGHGGAAYTQTHTYAPGAGSSYWAMQSQGLNSWKAGVPPGGLAPGGGGITGWQDGSGVGGGLLRPGVRGSALRRKTSYGAAPANAGANSNVNGGGGGGADGGGERRGAGNTKLGRLIPRFVRLSALVAAELGRESRGEEVGVGVGAPAGAAASAAMSPGSDRDRDRDRYTPPPLSATSRRSSDVHATPRQQQRQRTNTSASASSVTPTRVSAQADAQTQTPSKEREFTSNANALRPTKEWYMLLAGLLTRAVLEGYLTGGWRGLRAVQCLLMVGLGVSDGDGDGAGEGDERQREGQGTGRRRRAARRDAEVDVVDASGDEQEREEEEEEEDASETDSASDEEESSTDADSSDLDVDGADSDAAERRVPSLGLGFRLPVAGRDDDDGAGDANEDGDEEFAELDPDELPGLVEAVRILFPSLRGAGRAAEGKGKQREVGGVGDGELGEREGGRGDKGEKGEAEAEYEEEMLERLRRFYAIPESTPDCATHMEDLAWQYPAEPVERAAVRFCEAIARWRGKPELETYKKKPAPNDAQRDGDGETGGMSIDSLVHSNPVSPTMGAGHAQQQQVEMESIDAALSDSPPRRKRQPAIEDYFTGVSGARARQSQSLSPENGRSHQQYQHQESPSWARSGGGPNKRFRDPADDAGRAEKRMYA